MAEKSEPRAKKITLKEEVVIKKSSPSGSSNKPDISSQEAQSGSNAGVSKEPEKTGEQAENQTPPNEPDKNEGEEKNKENEHKKEGEEDKEKDKDEDKEKKEESGQGEEDKEKKGGVAEEAKKKVAENAAAAAAGAVTGGTGAVAVKGLAIFNSIAKYGKYVIIFFIVCLLFLYLVMVSGIYGGTGPQEPIDAKKNARDIEKVKAVTVNSSNKAENEALYKKITQTELTKSIEDLKSYLAENQNGLDPGEISEINTQLDGISTEFTSVKSDLDKLRELEAKKETELKLKDPDEFKDRAELRNKVDDKFSKMWKSIREIFIKLELNNV